MRDKKYIIWLYSLPGVGSRRFSNLIKYFGSAENIFNSNESDLLNSNIISPKLAKTITNNRNLEKIENYIKKVKENDIKVYTIFEELYPKNLKNIYDPPAVIYVRGDLKETDRFSVAVVGSRKASEYGLKAADMISQQLAENAVTVVSGMALGIDSAAHRGAIKAGGRTIAVFACGLNRVYPQSGLNLAKEIVKNGAIISEYPIGMEALPQNFPARNRIISGLSKGVVVVEAGEKSGSLITADFALEQGREVFAVPGNITSLNSKGTNELIKNGAKLVNKVEDILEELGFEFKQKAPEKSIKLDSLEEKILDIISPEGAYIDDIILLTGYPPGKIAAALTLLELKRIIQQNEGLYFKI